MGGNTSLDKEDILVGLTVRNCTFANTSDGVRIKTWESPHEVLLLVLLMKTLQWMVFSIPSILINIIALFLFVTPGYFQF
jgi:hypothetical protein